MTARGQGLRLVARSLAEPRGAAWLFGLVAVAVVLWTAVDGRSGRAAGERGGVLAAGLDGAGDDAALAPPLPDAEQRSRAARVALGGAAAAVGASTPGLDALLTARIRALTDAARERAVLESKGAIGASDVRIAVCVVELEPQPEPELGAPGTFGADPSRGRCLVAIDAQRGMRPASNMKLVTTAAALVAGGPAASFRTRFDATAPLADGVVAGDLVVRAGGDPFLGSPIDPALGGATDGSGVAALDAIARALAARGLRRVAGDLVLDEGTFESPAPGPEWPDASQHWKDYCSLAGGFTVNGGCLVAVIEPTAPERPARVDVRPADHGLRNDWSVTTRARGDIVIGFEARLGRVLVRGTIPQSVRSYSSACAHPDPVALFGHALLGALTRAGIELDGALRRERQVRATHTLHEHASPVAPCLVPINTDSNNGVADQLFFAAGLWHAGDASRAGAARATAHALEALGIPSAGLVQVDGSGLSFANRVTAEQLAGLLAAVHARATGLGSSDPGAERFRASLAVVGRTGTLQGRMRGTCAEGRVLAKTGFIRGTSALSGFVDAPRGPLALAILVEYPPHAGLNTSVFKPLQDAICTTLCDD